MLPPTIFFFVVFSILAFIRSLMNEEYGITIASSGGAIIGALILGKSILIADALPLFKLFRKRRLIYNVAWRILLYAAVVLFFQLLEGLIPLISEYGGFTTASEHFIEEVKWNHFWITHIVLVMFLAFYSFATALIGVIGRDRFLEIFFGRKRHLSPRSSPS